MYRNMGNAMIEKNDLLPTAIICGVLGIGVYLVNKADVFSLKEEVAIKPSFLSEEEFNKIKKLIVVIRDNRNKATEHNLISAYTEILTKLNKGEYNKNGQYIVLKYKYNKSIQTFSHAIG